MLVDLEDALGKGPDDVGVALGVNHNVLKALYRPLVTAVRFARQSSRGRGST